MFSNTLFLTAMILGSILLGTWAMVHAMNIAAMGSYHG